MALFATQELPLTGLNATYTAVSASDTFVPDDRTFIHVKNAGGSPDVVAVATPPTTGGLAIADVSVSVTNAQERFIGPFPASFFADPATGLATFTNSFTTTVTAAVIRIPARV